MVDEEDTKAKDYIHKIYKMIDMSKHFEPQTIIYDGKSGTIKHHTSDLYQLGWEDLKDDDLIEISHCTNGFKSSSGEPTYESRKISFKDLCHAVRVNLMMTGAIPFQGED